MPTRVALIHATPLAIAPMADSFARLWPDTVRMNVLDDSLSADRAAAGVLTPAMVGRFETLARYAVGCGAEAILFTCSAFGPAIEAAAAAVPVPVLKPNEAMLMEAAALARKGGGRLALVATFEPSLGSLAEELEAMTAGGPPIALDRLHVPGAMAALGAGDAATHDGSIADAVAGWPAAREADAVLLAQFSMARALGAAAARTPRPVLVSTDSAVAALKRAVAARG